MFSFLGAYESFLHALAKITVYTLETIGIFIVIFGGIKLLYQYLKHIRNKDAEPLNAVILLGRNLALALEFKMGAEIVNTVIVRELKELLVLGIVIALRALLAILIHWEITTEEKEERAHILSKERALAREQKNDTQDPAPGKENND